MEKMIKVDTTNIITREINLNRMRNLATPIGAGKLSPEDLIEIKEFHNYLKSLAENLSPKGFDGDTYSGKIWRYIWHWGQKL